MQVIKISDRAYKKIKEVEGNSFREKVDKLLFGEEKTLMEEPRIRDIVREEIREVRRH